MRLEGRRALVTGAASGIGAAIARRYVAEGARVALLDRDEAGIRALCESIGGTAHLCDVSDPASVTFAVDAGIAALGGLDVVVNSAGILIHQSFDTIEPEVWQKLFAVNLLGPSLVIRAALATLRLSKDAAIINISSMSAVKPSPGTAAYAATKAGLLMLGKCLAQELAPIRVNSICPGLVATAMSADLMADPAMMERIKAANVLHGVGQPDDMASAAVFLASRDSRFMTGTQMVIDGGSSFA